MLALRAARPLAAPLARHFGRTADVTMPVKEVMVSQSRDLTRNTALEDWAARNIDLTAKSVLILTNNLSTSPTNATVLDIKATLVDSMVMEKAAEFEEAVLASLPPSLLLSQLPDLARGRSLLEDGATTHTITLPLHTEVKARDVLTALDNIAKNFLKEDGLQRLNLVRPDGGWFNGLESVSPSYPSFLPLTPTMQVCHDLQQQMREGGRHLASLERQQERAPKAPFKEPHHEGRGLQNSYGQGV